MDKKKRADARERAMMVLLIVVPFLAVSVCYWGMMALYQVLGGR